MATGSKGDTIGSGEAGGTLAGSGKTTASGGGSQPSHETGSQNQPSLGALIKGFLKDPGSLKEILGEEANDPEIAAILSAAQDGLGEQIGEKANEIGKQFLKKTTPRTQARSGEYSRLDPRSLDKQISEETRAALRNFKWMQILLNRGMEYAEKKVGVKVASEIREHTAAQICRELSAPQVPAHMVYLGVLAIQLGIKFNFLPSED